VGLCFFLQQVSLPIPFFLSCRTLSRLAGRSHELTARWLRRFIKRKIISVVQVNVAGRRATRYYYVRLCNNTATGAADARNIITLQE